MCEASDHYEKLCKIANDANNRAVNPPGGVPRDDPDWLISIADLAERRAARAGEELRHQEMMEALKPLNVIGPELLSAVQMFSEVIGNLQTYGVRMSS